MTSEELAAIRARVEAVKHYAEIALADALTRYEDAAERFHRETGLMAPGKSEPLGWGGGEAHDAERRSRWEAWLMGDMRRRSSVEVELADDVARLTAEVERLRGELAEAQATLANERGEGEPPEERCVWDPACRQWKLVAGGKEIGFVSRGYQTRWAWEVCVGDRWLHGYALTARAAMRAAAKAVRGEP